MFGSMNSDLELVNSKSYLYMIEKLLRTLCLMDPHGVLTGQGLVHMDQHDEHVCEAQ